MYDPTESSRTRGACLDDTFSLPVVAKIAVSARHLCRKLTVRPVRHIAERRRFSCQSRGRAERNVTQSRLNDASLAVFSHEVRSSLGAINNAAQVLGMLLGTTSAGNKARLMIERQVSRMTRLVDELGGASRIAGVELPMRRERVDLRVAVKHAIETVESDLLSRNHRLTTSLPQTPMWLIGDPDRLEQVWVNLLVNAAKYTDDGGDISLRMQQERQQVIVRLHDSGIGIASDLLPYVFDLFVQADHSSRRAEAGSGIGLALVRRLVELHGGSVTAASLGLRHGSEFTVRLPLA